MIRISPEDQVRLINVPDWLIHDLPQDEQAEILSFIGRITQVTEIDSYGYFWVGFGHTTVDSDGSKYNGHSFCVPRDCLEKI